MTQEQDILKTAHIHVDSTTFRIHVEDAEVFDIEAMDEDESRPSCIGWVSRSNSSEELRKTSLLCFVIGEDYDLVEIAEWIKKYEKI